MRLRTVQQADKKDAASARLPKQSLSTAHSAESSGMARSLLNLQHTHGNRFVQRMMSQAMVQRQCSCGGKCENCQSGSTPDSQDVAQHILQRKGNGQPLESGARTFMETRFGEDFSGVRIHTDAHAAQSAQQLRASAYTIGRDIFFSAQHYRPQTRAGKWLLAHELVHVVQQQHNVLQSKPEIGQPGDVYEQEADRVASELMAVSESGSNSNSQPRPLLSAQQAVVRRSPLRISLAPDDKPVKQPPVEKKPPSDQECTGSSIRIEVIKPKDLSGVFSKNDDVAFLASGAATIYLPKAVTSMTQAERGAAILKWNCPDGKSGSDNGLFNYTFTLEEAGIGPTLTSGNGEKAASDGHIYGLAVKPGSEAKESAEKQGFDMEKCNWELAEKLEFTTSAIAGSKTLHRCKWGYRFDAKYSIAKGKKATKTASVNYTGVDKQTEG